MKVIYIRVNDAVKDSLQKAAKGRNISLNAYCNLVFMQHLKIMQGIDKTMGGYNGQ